MSLPWSSKRERNMFKTIVLALDGSDGAKQAIPVAAELAANEKAKIVIAKRRSRWPRSPSAALRTRSSRLLTATTAI